MLNQSSIPPIQTGMLKCIWHVDADETYSARYSRRGERDLAVVRTLDGAGVLDLDGVGIVTVPAGSVFVTEIGDVNYHGTYEDRWRFYWLEVASSVAIDLPLNEALPVPVASWEDALLGHVFDHLSLPDTAAQAASSMLVHGLLADWSARCQTPRTGNAAAEIVRNAVKHVNASRDAAPDLDALAAAIGISPRRMRQAFAQHTGRSPKRYFTEVRLRQAAQFLRMRRFNVTELAEHLGYASPFHFSRAFKAEYGCSPSAYVGRGNGEVQ
ncbi:MAG TPA: helix-turn-helix transcriptional regulator [Capsulimonadaceae bacterium]|jgi:AraC-like DNA-binding protein